MNIIFDYDLSFAPEVFQRLAETGIRVVYVFDYWHRHEPEPGRYDFHELVRYANVCRSAGLKMLLQTPIGSPLWMDESFYLYDECGHNSRHSDWVRLGPTHETGVMASRIPSYWHREAEEYTANYIQAIRCAIEPLGVTCIPNIGAFGEFMFPSTFFWFHKTRPTSPWWFDVEARKLWKDRDPVEWFREERGRIIVKRLAYYRGQWTQFIPYHDSWENWRLGNIGVTEALEKYAPHLKTILFTVFLHGEHLPVMAEQQARRFPAWGGAEGCANVVAHTKRALDLGLKGTLCRLIDPGVDEPAVPEWKYEALKTANGLFSEEDDKDIDFD